MVGRNSVAPWLQQRRLTIDVTVKERNATANGEVGKSTFERTACLDARHKAGHLGHRTCENDAENASALIYHGDQFRNTQRVACTRTTLLEKKVFEIIAHVHTVESVTCKEDESDVLIVDHPVSRHVQLRHRFSCHWFA